MFRPVEWPPPAFEARLLPSSWVIPLGLIGLGVLLVLSPAPGPWESTAGAAVIGLGVLVVRLRWASRITLRGNDLGVAFFSPRVTSVSLAHVARVSARRSKASLGLAPALEVRSREGSALTIRLGWWRREPELLQMLGRAVSTSKAELDEQAAQLLRDRPSGESWSVGQRQSQGATESRGWGPVRRLRRLPAPVNWIAELALFALAMVAIYALLEGAVRVGENVVFPRQIDAAWETQVDLPTQPGDSWVGNLATEGERTYLAVRQDVRGFWGRIAVWSSDDGGATWLSGVIVSRVAWQDAARHALAVAPDATLFVAFAEQGPAPATQRLMVRTSRDGVSWAPAIPVSPSRVGLIGLPVFLLTRDVHLVGFTDGETGDVLVQRLGADGTPLGEPAKLGQTTRQLYSDADFHDAAIALASAQGRVVAVWVEGDHALRASVSSDAGRSWDAVRGLDQELYGGRPRLASDGTDILLAASDPNRGARYVHHPYIRIWRSSDGGQTFTRGPDVTDVEDVGSLEVIWSDGRWRLLFDACPGFLTCATPPRVWYTESADGDAWSEPIVVSAAGPMRLVGLIEDRFALAAVWGEELGPHAWAFHLARRQP